MIAYFSGTGNSKAIAERLAVALGEQAVSIPTEMDRMGGSCSYYFEPDAVLGIVFPVHSWGPPRIVSDFVAGLRLEGSRPFIFTVATCGEEEGRTTPILRKRLEAKGLGLDSAFSVRMPNNFIVGFDVDPASVVEEKLAHAALSCRVIEAVASARQSGVFQLIPGRLAGLKSALFYPLFDRWGHGTRSFRATDACDGCGLCEAICPVHAIKVNGKPVWNGDCAQCMGCLHRCPVRAIQYGRGTEKKERYVHPEMER